MAEEGISVVSPPPIPTLGGSDLVVTDLAGITFWSCVAADEWTTFSRASICVVAEISFCSGPSVRVLDDEPVSSEAGEDRDRVPGGDSQELRGRVNS